MLPALLLALALQAPTPAPAEPPATHAPELADPLRGDWGKPSGKRVTLSSSLTVSAALERIADAAGWSLVIDAGSTGEKALTLRLRDVPAEDAFRAVLSQAGLVADRRGSLVTVRAEGLLPGILPPGVGREAQRATQEALETARRAMGDTSRDDDEDAPDGRDRHSAGGDLVIGSAEKVRDAVTWHGDVRLSPAALARNVVAFRGSVTLGPDATSRDAVAFAGKTVLGPGARVRHDAVAFGGDVELGPGAEVMHDAVSIGGTVRVDPTARVHGSIHSIPFPGMPGFPRALGAHLVPHFPSPLQLLLQALVTFVVLFVLGLGVVALFPGRLEAVSAALAGGPLRSIFAGLFGTVGMVFLSVLLILTVVGLLLLPVQLLAMVAGGVLGIVAFTCYLGRVLPFPRSRRTLVLELAAGTLIFSVLVHVPILGGMVWLATWFLGFGAVLRTRFGAPSSVLPTTPAPERT